MKRAEKQDGNKHCFVFIEQFTFLSRAVSFIPEDSANLRVYQGCARSHEPISQEESVKESVVLVANEMFSP